ncbi:hypothetical protein [Lysobacter gummosus]|uniref:hypothetical protein n=1 Tax=Lysobacter gummosus TaxID=262324 RepID=UPI00362728EB
MQSAERDRCGDHQLALGRAEFAGGTAFGFLDIVKDAPTGDEVSRAGIGEHELAR